MTNAGRDTLAGMKPIIDRYADHLVGHGPFFLLVSFLPFLDYLAHTRVNGAGWKVQACYKCIHNLLDILSDGLGDAEIRREPRVAIRKGSCAEENPGSAEPDNSRLLIPSTL